MAHRILHAIHDFLPRHRAGSEIYAHHLCRELGRRHHVHVLCTEYDPSRPHGELAWRMQDGVPVTELVNNWRFSTFEESYASPLIARRLGQVLDAVQPDVLHVHNLLNSSFDLPRLARARGIPCVATLHDHGLVCPSGGQRVHVAEAHVCHAIDAERCRRCFGQSHFHAQMAYGAIASSGGRPLVQLLRLLRSHAPGLLRVLSRAAATVPLLPVGAADIEARLSRARELFTEIDLFVAPSPSIGRAFIELGLPAERLVVSDYGFAPLHAPARVRDIRPGSKLAIGFVGTLVWHKGTHVLLEAARKLPADRIDVSLWGDPETFPEYSKRLRESARGLPVRFRGPFGEAERAAVYGSMDVLVVPSLWPENSPLVIHEAFMALVPVVGARMGGIPDLIVDGGNGLLYDATSAEDLARALARLLDEPGLLSRLASAGTSVKTIEEDARAWEERYERVLASRRVAIVAAIP